MLNTLLRSWLGVCRKSIQMMTAQVKGSAKPVSFLLLQHNQQHSGSGTSQVEARWRWKIGRNNLSNRWTLGLANLCTTHVCVSLWICVYDTANISDRPVKTTILHCKTVLDERRVAAQIESWHNCWSSPTVDPQGCLTQDVLTLQLSSSSGDWAIGYLNTQNEWRFGQRKG